MKRKFQCSQDNTDVLIVSDFNGDLHKSMEFYIKGGESSVILDKPELKMLHEMIGAVLRR